ncbi:MAG: hypothetical protein QXV73_03945 [Candidatus Micrarchaeia archaeon]
MQIVTLTRPEIAEIEKKGYIGNQGCIIEKRGDKYYLLSVIAWDCYAPTSWLEEEIQIKEEQDE